MRNAECCVLQKHPSFGVNAHKHILVYKRSVCSIQAIVSYNPPSHRLRWETLTSMTHHH